MGPREKAETAVGLKLLPILHTVSQWVSAKLGRILRADWNMLGLYLLVCEIWEIGLVRLETLVPDLRMYMGHGTLTLTYRDLNLQPLGLFSSPYWDSNLQHLGLF